MRIGIDISQIAFEGTGVGLYVKKMVSALLSIDTHNTYILFGASLRQRQKFIDFFKLICQKHPNVHLVIVPIPPTLLDFLWNKLHVLAVERFIGPVDIFWSSDWTQPPLLKARGITTIHDVSFLKFPESFNQTMREVQRRRLAWAQRTCRVFLCDSEATRQDASQLLGIDRLQLKVVYPGFN